MAKRGFTNQLRDYLKTREGQEVTTEDMANAVDLGFGTKWRQKLGNTIGDLKRRGELERVGKGVYRYVGRKERATVSQVEKMWRTLRSRRIVSVEDMQEIAGARAYYVKDFMRALERRGVVARRGDKWALVKDPILRPEVLTDAAKKQILEDRKAALAAIDTAMQALLGARMAVADIGREDEA